MSVCVLQNLEKYGVLWTDFLASCRDINRFSDSKIGPEPTKPTISLALLCAYTFDKEKGEKKVCGQTWYPTHNYCISSVIRQSFFPSKTIPKI